MGKENVSYRKNKTEEYEGNEKFVHEGKNQAPSITLRS